MMRSEIHILTVDMNIEHWGTSMVDKKVIIGGFVIGVAAGSTMLTIAAHNPVLETDAATKIAAPVVAPSAQSIRDGIADKMTEEIMSGLQTPPTFEEMVDQVAREQGGKISIAQMSALADIYRRLHGTPPDHGGQLSYRSLGGTGSSNGSAIAFSDPYKVLGPSRSLQADGLMTGDQLKDYEEGGGYRGNSGARYQYDLSRPGDEVRYSVDVGAQLRDQLRDSVDPRVEMDRSMGQYGGGIERR